MVKSLVLRSKTNMFGSKWPDAALRLLVIHCAELSFPGRVHMHVDIYSNADIEASIMQLQQS